MSHDVYLGLGGNIGNTKEIFIEVIRLLQQSPHIEEISLSKIYRTTPVSPILQRHYLNAVCKLKTTLEKESFFQKILEIEILIGKTTKKKEEPRIIDIDLLFFGREKIKTEHLEIPHPRWRERLFVLVPLFDLTSAIEVPLMNSPDFEKVDLRETIANFDNKHGERVIFECCFSI